HVCDVSCDSNEDCKDLAVARSCVSGFCRRATGDELDASSASGGASSGGASNGGASSGGAPGLGGGLQRGGTNGDASAGAGGRLPGFGGAPSDADVPEGGICDACNVRHPIAVDATNVYWSTSHGNQDKSGFVYKMSLSGGPATAIAAVHS